MISLLVPTRKRHEKLKRMIDSVRATVLNDVEILCYVTPDDDSYGMASEWDAKFVEGPRMKHSDLWNALLPHATGDILQQTADDVIYRTPAWDRYIEDTFSLVSDRILLAYGYDGSPNGENFATLPFVSREWVNAVGYFTGPGFTADFSDTWPFDVAKMIGRTKYLPLYFEHTHWMWGKSEVDETYKEINDLRVADNNTALYNERLPERMADADKLRAVMR
jgi:hypothetical protein